jgi:hypothetical protein
VDIKLWNASPKCKLWTYLFGNRSSFLGFGLAKDYFFWLQETLQRLWRDYQHKFSVHGVTVLYCTWSYETKVCKTR